MWTLQRVDKMFYIILALMAGLIPLATLISCYVVATELNHSVPGNKLPRLSDLGDEAPEILIFSIGLCTASSLQLMLVLFRYVQIKTFHRPPVCPIMNATALLVGWLMVLGQMMLVSVRHSDAILIHYLGKTIQFSASCIYITIQSYMSVMMVSYHNRCLAYFRCVLAVLTTISAVTLVTGLGVKELIELGIPEASEIAVTLFTAVFWMSLAADFHRNKMDLVRQQGKTKIRIRHRSGSGATDNHRVINYLHSIIEDCDIADSKKPLA